MKKSGFTLTETLITLAIIGVCAAMLIGTIKNLKTDDLSNDALAKKTVTSFTDATKQILYYHSKTKKMNDVQDGGTACTGEVCLLNLYRKYLNIARFLDTTEANGLAGTKHGQLTDGVTFGITYNSACNISSDGSITVNPTPDSSSVSVTNVCGIIYFDVNGNKKPNRNGVDRFSIPIKKSGVRIPSPTAS